MKLNKKLLLHGVPCFLVFAFAIISSSCSNTMQPKKRKPNFIIIQADDLGFDDLPINGNKYVNAPNIDKLANASVIGNNFYVNPVCAPSRASLLTGRNFLLTGVSHVHGGKDFVNLSEKTFADIFKQEGYATGIWGKWHSGKTEGYYPWQRGFDEAYMAELYIHENSFGLYNGEKVAFNKWSDEVIVDYALNFVERNKNKPFVAYLSFLNVHAPLAAKEELIKTYQNKGLSRNLATLYAMVEQMDTQIGRFLKELKNAGLDENTVVIFLSDNGPAILNNLLTDEDRSIRYSGKYKGHKGNIWNNGVKSPLLIKYPGKLKPNNSDALIDVTDIFPTMADIAGIDLKKYELNLRGTSFWNCLLNNDAERPEKLVFNYAARGWPPSDMPWTPGGVKNEYEPTPDKVNDSSLQYRSQIISIQNDDYKLLKNASRRENNINNEYGYCLIDIKKDPFEQQNTIDQHPQVFKEMETRLHKYYNNILHAKNSFQPITFIISENKENRVLLYAPTEKSEELKIAYEYSYPWNKSGLFAVYNVEVENNFTAIPIVYGTNIPKSMNFILEIDDAQTTSKLLNDTLIVFHPMGIPKGQKSLRLMLENTPENQNEVQLFELMLLKNERKTLN